MRDTRTALSFVLVLRVVKEDFPIYHALRHHTRPYIRYSNPLNVRLGNRS